MRAIIILGIGLVASCFARENPFLPTSETVTTPTNIQEQRGDFEQQATTLPSRARVLQYVVFGYQGVDGGTEELRMEVDKNVDWHDPLVVTTESLLLRPAPVSVPSEPVPEPLRQETVELKQPLVKEVGFGGFIVFEATQMRLKVLTNDVLVRHFMVADPYKVVLDFERDTAFYTKVLEVKNGAFKTITMGNHNGRYRAAILLDGHYLYKLKKIEDGYEVLLK